MGELRCDSEWLSRGSETTSTCKDKRDREKGKYAHTQDQRDERRRDGLGSRVEANTKKRGNVDCSSLGSEGRETARRLGLPSNDRAKSAQAKRNRRNGGADAS